MKDNKDIPQMCKTVNDIMDSISTYCRDGGQMSDNLYNRLKELCREATIIKHLLLDGEATSGIGGGSYTTQAIDLLPQPIKKPFKNK